MRVHSFTLSYTPESIKCASRASLLSRTLASFYLGHKPKARVMIVNEPYDDLRLLNHIFSFSLMMELCYLITNLINIIFNSKDVKNKNSFELSC